MSLTLTTYSSLAGFVGAVPPSCPIHVEPVVEWYYQQPETRDGRMVRISIEVAARSALDWGVAEIDLLSVEVGEWGAFTQADRSAAVERGAAAADVIRRTAACYWETVREGRVYTPAEYDEIQHAAYNPREWQQLAEAGLHRDVAASIKAAKVAS